MIMVFMMAQSDYGGGSGFIVLCSASHHLSQLVLAGEVVLENLEFANDLTTGSKNGLLRRDLTVRLDTELELGEKRVGDL